MSNEEQEYKKFLVEQVDWCKEQEKILIQIEIKLREMKKLAESVLIFDFTNIEIKRINLQINQLNREVLQLKEQLNSIVH